MDRWMDEWMDGWMEGTECLGDCNLSQRLLKVVIQLTEVEMSSVLPQT
jgi:hypothetical protein